MKTNGLFFPECKNVQKSAQEIDSRAVRFHNFLRICKGAGNHLVHSTYELTDGINREWRSFNGGKSGLGKVPQPKIGKKEGSVTRERAQYYPLQDTCILMEKDKETLPACLTEERVGCQFGGIRHP